MLGLVVSNVWGRYGSKAGKGFLETYKQKVRDGYLSFAVVSFMGIFYDRFDVVDIQIKIVRFAVEKLLRLHVIGKISGIDPLVQPNQVIVQDMIFVDLGHLGSVL